MGGGAAAGEWGWGGEALLPIRYSISCCRELFVQVGGLEAFMHYIWAFLYLVFYSRRLLDPTTEPVCVRNQLHLPGCMHPIGSWQLRGLSPPFS